MITNHIASFVIGFILDLMFGDPHWLPHPIRLIGRISTTLEQSLRKDEKKKQLTDTQLRARGTILVILVLLISGMGSALVLYVSYQIHRFVGIGMASIMTYQILALKCLKQESMNVYRNLKRNDIEGARLAVSMIVGRDTKVLNDIGLTKAAVETVAENASDGVIAPMLFLALGGPVLGFLYKAVNTMDSMIGYKNEHYISFGRTAALLDDVANYLPARISALLMIGAAAMLGKEFNAKEALRIYQRDRYQHASPNSAHTESVCAGALGIQLAGDAVYFGKVVSKPTIGDTQRPVEYEDIVRANTLLYGSAMLCFFLCLTVMFGLFDWISAQSLLLRV